jgi:excisionase family DNA binding protein
MGKKQNSITIKRLKTEKASEYLGVSRRHLLDLVKEGRVPCAKLSPRCYVFEIADLDALLASCKIGGDI